MSSARLAAALGLLGVAAAGGHALAADPTWVLGPGAEAGVRQLAVALQTASGLAPGPSRIVGSEVRFELRVPGSGSLAVWRLRHDREAPRDIALSVGWLAPPADTSPDLVRAVRAALEGTGATLPWVSVAEPAGSRLTLTDALPMTRDMEVAGRVAEARLATTKARDTGPLPAPRPSRERGAADSLRSTRGAPDLWVAAARTALDARRPRQALALADVATRLGQPDRDAVALWRELTAPTGGDPWWPTVALLLGLCGWLAAVQRMGPRPGTRALALVACALALGAHGVARGTAAAGAVQPPAVPDALVAPLAGGVCDADPALWVDDGLAFYATCAAEPLELRVVARRDEGGPALATEAHTIVVLGPGGSPAARAGVQQLAEAVRRAEETGFRVTGWAQETGTHTAPALPRPGSLDRVEAALALAVTVLGAIVALALWVGMVRWSLRTATDRRLRLALGALGLVATLAACLLPGRLVMEYTGYDLTARLALLAPLPRYGAGAVWLYQPALALLGVDHASLQVANRVFGLLAFVPVVALGLAATRGARRHTVWAAALFVLLPVVARDHVSEGIGAATGWLLVTGIAAVGVALADERQRSWAVLALAPLAAAAACRPEAGPALGALTLGALAATTRWAPRRRAALVLGAVAVATVLLPHGVWLARSAADQVADAGILGGAEALTHQLPEVLTRLNIFVDGPWVSPVLLLLVAVAVARDRERRAWWLGLIAAAVLWIAASAVDLPRVSIPRVHLPALLLLLPMVAAGAERLCRSTRGQLAAGVIGLLTVAPAAWTAPALWAPSNAEGEDALIRAAVRALPERGGCVATPRFGDPPPAGDTQRHFPDYLFAPAVEVLGLSGFPARQDACLGSAVALLGTRCFMTMRPPDRADEAPADGELAMCREFRQRYMLEPVVELDLPNRTAGTFPMYPSRELLPVGVYRVVAEAGGSP